MRKNVKREKKRRQQGVTHTQYCIAAPKKRKKGTMRSFRMALLGVLWGEWFVTHMLTSCEACQEKYIYMYMHICGI